MKISGFKILFISIFMTAGNILLGAEILALPNQNTLYLIGEIESQDRLKIAVELTLNPHITEIALDSTGGSLEEGWAISELVTEKALDTKIVEGRDCASSCALIFVSGTKRLMPSGSRIGFHSPFVDLGYNELYGYCLAISTSQQEIYPFASMFKEAPSWGLNELQQLDCITSTYQAAMLDASRLVEMFDVLEISKDVLIEMLSTPPDAIRWFESDEAAKYNITTE